MGDHSFVALVQLERVNTLKYLGFLDVTIRVYVILYSVFLLLLTNIFLCHHQRTGQTFHLSVLILDERVQYLVKILYAWFPDEASSWPWWPPDFSTCATMRLTFLVFSEMSHEPLGGLIWNLVETIMSPSGWTVITHLPFLSGAITRSEFKFAEYSWLTHHPQLCFVYTKVS